MSRTPLQPKSFNKLLEMSWSHFDVELYSADILSTKIR